MPALRYPLPPATIDDIARASGCSARTVRRYLGGHSVSGATLVAVSRALRDRRLIEHVRPAPEAASGPAAVSA